ncbi:MAG: hypothetical protein ACM3S5_11435 [Rhodospirillales bacterium]
MPASGGQEVSEVADRVAAQAYAAFPELGAHALIQLAESRYVRDVGRKRELLLDAWALAGRAQYGWPVELVGGHHTDTRQGLRAVASELMRMDTLTLRSEVVRVMWTLNRTEALDLLENTPLPTVPPATCADLTVYAPAVYFRVLRDVVATQQSGVREEDAKRAEELLLRILARVRHPSEVRQSLELLGNAKLSPRTFEAAMLALAGAMSHITADSRSFGQNMFLDGPLQPVLETCLEWQSRVDGLLRALDDWSVSEEDTPEDHFVQRCLVLRALLGTIPEDLPQHHKALQMFVAALSTSEVQKHNRAMRLWHVTEFFRSAPPDKPSLRASVGEALQQSGNPNLLLLADLAVLFPPAKNP